MTLIRYVVSFLLADMPPTTRDAELVLDFADALRLSSSDTATALAWLTSPPDIEDLDPTALPARLVPAVLASVDLVLAACGAHRPRARELRRLLAELTASPLSAIASSQPVGDAVSRAA